MTLKSDVGFSLSKIENNIERRKFTGIEPYVLPAMNNECNSVRMRKLLIDPEGRI